MDGRDRRANYGVAGRRWARPALLIALVASAVARGGSVWELEQLWEDDIVAYVQKFTGDVDSQGTPIESKFLRYEQTGWYQKIYDRTSVGMDKVRPPHRRGWDARAPPVFILEKKPSLTHQTPPPPQSTLAGQRHCGHGSGIQHRVSRRGYQGEPAVQ